MQFRRMCVDSDSGSATVVCFATPVPCRPCILALTNPSGNAGCSLHFRMRRKLVLLSHRQPFRHERRTPDAAARVTRPVSGLLSAVEPVMQEYGGTWIARSCGNADIEAVDENGIWQGPSGFRLKRLFFNQNELDGHTHGFSNGALWPLCHIAYQKPEFRRSSWRTYQAVNARFAEAAAQEKPDAETHVLVQDFHLALTPALLRRRLETGLERKDLPGIALFWHIPWPPADVMARCPWIGELIEGMLGSDLVGFHTQEDCDHFLATCAQLLGLPIRESAHTVRWDGRDIRVRPIPVSIAPAHFERLEWSEKSKFWKQRLGIESRRIALAVDRMDPTKGILERLAAYELLLERRPSLGADLTLVQVATPCRTELAEYRRLSQELASALERIRTRHRLRPERSPPVVLIQEPQDWRSLSELYQMSDLCIASPLHDGMNLVAKEYAWCQGHHQGALVLSRFAGASREFGRDAWMVNPHDPDGFAEVLAEALEAPEAEREARMSRLRRTVTERTALDWGNQIIRELEDRL